MFPKSNPLKQKFALQMEKLNLIETWMKINYDQSFETSASIVIKLLSVPILYSLPIFIDFHNFRFMAKALKKLFRE